MILEINNINIQTGKSYKLRLPDYCCDSIKVYIEYILDNPISKDENDTLIIVRYWLRHKKKWRYKVYEYWWLQMYNDGSFERMKQDYNEKNQEIK